MVLTRAHIYWALIMPLILLLISCQPEAPAPKQSSTQSLLAQVEAIEADESALLFQQAQAAAQKDNVNEAKSLLRQALGRGAGSAGMANTEAEIRKAEARILERERKAEEARRAIKSAEAASIASRNSNTNKSTYSRVTGVREIQGINVGDGYADT